MMMNNPARIQLSESSATISPDGLYRYDLWRHWIGGTGYALFVMLNPSTADATQDDPTIRRCIGYAKQWGYEGLAVCNLFAFRATSPKVMLKAVDPVGPNNDIYLRATADRAGIVVAAWGKDGKHLGRGDAVRAMLPRMRVLRLNLDNTPQHPLYLPKSLVPIHWPAPAPTLVASNAHPQTAGPGPSRSLPVKSRAERERLP